MQRFKSHSEQETKQIAENLAKHTKANIFALTGELGAGKTIFIQGFAKGLGITEKIISPTFVLIRQHRVPKLKKILYHIDLYRLVSGEDFKQLGLDEILEGENSIVLIEWAEKLKELPDGSIKINITKDGDQGRIIAIS